MSQPKKKESPNLTNSSPANKKRWWRFFSARQFVIAAVSLAAILFLAAVFCGVAYAAGANGIIRSSTIGQVSVGKLDTSAATALIESRWNEYVKNQIVFQAGDKKISLDPSGTQKDGEELVTEIVSFDAISSVNAAAAFGHTGTFWQQLRERVSGFIGRQHEFGKFAFAGDVVKEALEEQTSGLSETAVDATIEITNGQPMVTESKNGNAYDVTRAVNAAARQAARFSTAPVDMVKKTVFADYEKNEVTINLAETETATVQKRAPITLTGLGKTWTIDEKKLNTLLGFRRDENNEIHVGFDQEKTLAYFETLRKSIDQDAAEARFEIINGKVKAFSTSQTGHRLNAAASLVALNNLLDQAGNKIALVITETSPISEDVAANDLGITELVGTATTNFRGSPTNRRYNINHGVELLNGLIIQPGETFSLVSALGKIDAAHGWKSELVIKGTKITPEYGGGLCQVATTLFRAALNTGLPIVERSNHSLRISYYEPPIGLDATIYEPKPDLRFTNDYGHAILIQAKISGTLITFNFYGTKDGRKVTLPTPKVYNRVAIPATKYIEVSDLKPGEKVCQTPGHPGADATATYTVTKADGTSKTQTFQSHYRAIGVICRVGKKKTTTKKTTTNTNSSTNTNTPANTNTGTDTNTSTNTNS